MLLRFLRASNNADIREEADGRRIERYWRGCFRTARFLRRRMQTGMEALYNRVAVRKSQTISTGETI